MSHACGQKLPTSTMAPPQMEFIYHVVGFFFLRVDSVILG